MNEKKKRNDVNMSILLFIEKNYREFSMNYCARLNKTKTIDEHERNVENNFFCSPNEGR
jgi:hypothetical protein